MSWFACREAALSQTTVTYVCDVTVFPFRPLDLVSNEANRHAAGSKTVVEEGHSDHKEDYCSTFIYTGQSFDENH